jgi:sarcosine oxidase
VASVVIVGAGVFGASIADRLARRGWEVALVEQFEPGNERGSSGGESRLLRFSHGTDRWYTRSAWRARAYWRELQEESGEELIVSSGLAWFARRRGGWEDDSERLLREEQIPVERLEVSEATALFPSLHGDDLAFVLYEPHAGVLRASRAVRALVDRARAHGARVVTGRACPDGRGAIVAGRRLVADHVVWACGGWLPKLFPEIVAVRVTRQDVFFFRASSAWRAPGVPAWVDYDGAFYGHGDVDGAGIKLCSDAEGPELDPDAAGREPWGSHQRLARAYLRLRFPALVGAPVALARVCLYELTADTNFIVAPHPGADGVWLVGGGSGHGFKHGPTLAEHLEHLLAGSAEPDPRFGLSARRLERSLRTAGTGAQGAIPT